MEFVSAFKWTRGAQRSKYPANLSSQESVDCKEGVTEHKSRIATATRLETCNSPRKSVVQDDCTIRKDKIPLRLGQLVWESAEGMTREVFEVGYFPNIGVYEYPSIDASELPNWTQIRSEICSCSGPTPRKELSNWQVKKSLASRVTGFTRTHVAARNQNSH